MEGQASPEIAAKLRELAELEPAARKREFRGYLGLLVSAIAVAFALFHLWRASVGLLPAPQMRAIHLGFALVLTFLVHPMTARSRRESLPLLDVILALLGIAVNAYVVIGYVSLSSRVGTLSPWDLIFGVVAIILVLEGARRVIGPPLPIIAMVALAYAFFGNYAPGILQHRGYDFERIVSHMYLLTEGIYGVPLGVSANYVVMFVLISAFLQVSGAADVFFQFAQALLGGYRGGPAKVSVVASSLFGTISGSAVANVVVDGWLTIPLMKRIGYKAHAAAAIEATASTGGQIMPPIMAAAAFIIAEILGMPYIQVAAAAALPAILYYVALYFMIDLEAAREGLKGLRREELPSLKRVVLGGWHLMVPIVLLVYLLGPVDWSPPKAALWSIVAAVVISWLRGRTKMGPREILEALQKGGLGTLEVALACACAGIVIGVLTLTGLALNFSHMLVGLAGGNLLALLILTMIASLILGMGLPTTAAYIVLSVLVAPALIRVGVEPIAAHLFIFYFGAISAITPPVALAAYAAAGIAGTDPFKTGWTATKFGLAGFIVPYMFVYGPALVLKAPAGEIALAAVTGSFGAAALAASLQGYVLTRASLLERVLLGAAALLLIKPGWETDLVGLALLVVVGIVQLMAWRAQRRKTASVEGEVSRGTSTTQSGS